MADGRPAVGSRLQGIRHCAVQGRPCALCLASFLTLRWASVRVGRVHCRYCGISHCAVPGQPCSPRPPSVTVQPAFGMCFVASAIVRGWGSLAVPAPTSCQVLRAWRALGSGLSGFLRRLSGQGGSVLGQRWALHVALQCAVQGRLCSPLPFQAWHSWNAYACWRCIL